MLFLYLIIPWCMQNNNYDTFAFQRVSTILGLLKDMLHIGIDNGHSGSIAIAPYLEEWGLTVLALSHKQHSECSPCSCSIGTWCIQHFRLKEMGFLLFNVQSFNVHKLWTTTTHIGSNASAKITKAVWWHNFQQLAM